MDLRQFVIAFSQFPVNGLDLFPQIIIPLVLGNLVFDIGLNLGLNRCQRQLPGQKIIDFFQPFRGVEKFQQILGIFGAQVEVGRHQIRQFTR